MRPDEYMTRNRVRRFTPMLGFTARPRVDLKLTHCLNTEQVYWSVRSNSYVVCDNPTGMWITEHGVRCDLLSINGHGEIRWAVTAEQGNTEGDTDAAGYFGLTWHGWD